MRGGLLQPRRRVHRVTGGQALARRPRSAPTTTSPVVTPVRVTSSHAVRMLELRCSVP